ncbi:hypothetical protein SAMN05660284_02555 [Formivibrio citricus]|uniref:Uncharacterized protein n=1 Tax=Formivibrio citricus TaxID=83765 RepID=A0A1I5D1T9_9NEIS|nr:hypothetical protein [Formivibrio citricus]SFN93210.1 hypothetical protein SAMN05660284_02555 [Formivibrio citricus]
MPRSIQQLKHREISLANHSCAQVIEAARRLEKMPGVSAQAVPEQCRLAVHYWVDEYMLADLELALACSGFQLDDSSQAKAQRGEILHDEEAEREQLDIPLRPSCKSCGVFARRFASRKDDLGSLPFLQ